MKILQQLYPLELSIRKRFSISLLFGAFIFVFLLLFQPFHLGSSVTSLGLIAVGYGIVCSVGMIVCNVLVFKLIPSLFKENRWTIGTEILWSSVNILTIGFANAVYSSYVFDFSFLMKYLLRFELYTLAVSLIPLAGMVLINYSRLNKKYHLKSGEMNKMADTNPSPPLNNSTAPTLTWKDKGQAEYSIDLTDLLFIQSADNYLEVHYHRNGEKKKTMLRKTMKAMAQELSAHDNMYQVHRSFLVNLDRVKFISGNAQGLKLHLAECDDLIPVSRKLTDALKKRFATRHSA